MLLHKCSCPCVVLQSSFRLWLNPLTHNRILFSKPIIKIHRSYLKAELLNRTHQNEPIEELQKKVNGWSKLNMQVSKVNLKYFLFFFFFFEISQIVPGYHVPKGFTCIIYFLPSFRNGHQNKQTISIVGYLCAKLWKAFAR